MKAIVGIIGFVLLLQVIFDAMMFNFIIHGEVAWRWQTQLSPAFTNSPETYPGYYCGQHNCTLNTEGGIQPNLKEQK